MPDNVTANGSIQCLLEALRTMTERAMCDFDQQNRRMLCQIGKDGLQFFAAFSRMEYALKEAAFVREIGSRSPKSVSADWHVFANRGLPKKFFQTCVSDPVVKTLINDPPKRQIKNSESASRPIKWSCQPDKPNDSKSLTEALQNIRNNLFHGGKGHDFTERDRNLIKAGLRLIELMLEHTTCRRVKAAYLE
jgi:hypothetical protein